MKTKSYFLERLASKKCLFETFPKPAVKRIIGLESEYGVASKITKNDEIKAIIDSHRLPVIPPNGGRIYIDCEHLEYCTPETTNPVEAVAYYEAGKRICFQEKYSPELFINTTDWWGQSFGAHENYFCKLSFEEKLRLVPFLVARTILCGSGWQKNKYNISQRSSYINRITSDSATINQRSIINERIENLAQLSGWNRFHVICGDATVSELSTFIRVGFTSLVIELLELGALPKIDYTDQTGELIADLRRLNSITAGDWWMTGVKKGPRYVLDLLDLFLQAAEKEFGGRDEITDALIVVIEDTLKKLGKEDYTSLQSRLDWVAKLTLINRCSDWNEWEKRTVDLAYHNLNPSESLYHSLIIDGSMERLISDEMIRQAVISPPPNSRAYPRGVLARFLKEEISDRGFLFEVKNPAWEEISIVRSEINRKLMTQSKTCWSAKTPNPFDNYVYLVEMAKKEIKSILA
jgi:proteasome accessory factor A